MREGGDVSPLRFGEGPGEGLYLIPKRESTDRLVMRNGVITDHSECRDIVRHQPQCVLEKDLGGYIFGQLKAL